MLNIVYFENFFMITSTQIRFFFIFLILAFINCFFFHLNVMLYKNKAVQAKYPKFEWEINFAVCKKIFQVFNIFKSVISRLNTNIKVKYNILFWPSSTKLRCFLPSPINNATRPPTTVSETIYDRFRPYQYSLGRHICKKPVL